MLAAGRRFLRLSKGLRLSIFLTHFDSLTFRTQVPAPKALTQTQVGKAINIPPSPTPLPTQATRYFFPFPPNRTPTPSSLLIGEDTRAPTLSPFLDPRS